MSYGLLVECLWFFQAILAKCSGFVPGRDENIDTIRVEEIVKLRTRCKMQTSLFRSKMLLLIFNTRAACTIFLHVLPAGVAEHLWRCWSCHHPVAVDHHLHVLVHGIDPVHILETHIFTWYFTLQHPDKHARVILKLIFI